MHNTTSYLELHLSCPLDQAIANNNLRQLGQGNISQVTEQTIRNVW